MTGDAKARCELAMMGKVVKCTTSEVLDCTKYIATVLNKWDKDIQEKISEFVANIKAHDNVKVRMMVCNIVCGDPCITFLLETSDLPKPFETDYGTGYPCSYGYVLNLAAIYCSEYGDSFYEKKSDGFYHRIS